MFTSLGAFITSLVTSARDVLVVPIVAISLLMGGAVWALGNHRDGKMAIVAALTGGAIMLLSITLAQALGGIAH